MTLTSSADIDSKLPKVGTTIFTVMSKMAADCGALNLSQGFPDFSGPEELLSRVDWHIRQGHNQYAPMAGLPALRAQIAAKIERYYGRSTCPESEVTVVPGATEAIYCAITATIRPGDEVIVFDPCYDSYEPAVELAGGVTRHLHMAAPNFLPDWGLVGETINDRTRMIIINSPHNPTGSVLQKNDLDHLAELVKNSNILILSDEVYEHLVYDSNSHHSVLAHPGLKDRSFAVFSFGKTFHVTGWKTGYCVAPATLTAELRKVHQYVAFVAVTPLQHALADFMEAEPDYPGQLGDFYQAKRDLFCDALASSRFEFAPSAGTYFQLLDYSQVSTEGDVELAERLTRECGVASIPVSVFCEHPGDYRYLRLCFAKSDDTLEEACERLCRI